MSKGEWWKHADGQHRSRQMTDDFVLSLASVRNFLGERFTKEIYSSDFALQYALAARGWIIMPWEEAAQMHDNKVPKIVAVTML